MKIIRDYQFVNTSDRGASVAVGNFDGVHLGHQHVIEIARVWGKKNKSPLGVLTFEPCLLYTSPSPRDRQKSRMPSSA